MWKKTDSFSVSHAFLLEVAGPLFYLSALLIAPQKGLSTLLVAGSFLLSAGGHFRGWLVGIPLLGALFWISGTPPLPVEGWAVAALGCASLITALGFAEKKALLQQERFTHKKNIDQAQEALEERRLESVAEKQEQEKRVALFTGQLKDAQDQVDFHKRLMELSGAELVKARQAHQETSREALLYQKRLAESEEGQRHLLDTLNTVRVDCFQYALLADPSPKKDPESYSVEYKQLRRQFDEKSTVLHQTRRELFYLENKYLALCKEQENERLECNQEADVYEAQMRDLADTCQELESEVAQLEQVIQTLLEGSPAALLEINESSMSEFRAHFQ